MKIKHLFLSLAVILPFLFLVIFAKTYAVGLEGTSEQYGGFNYDRATDFKDIERLVRQDVTDIFNNKVAPQIKSLTETYTAEWKRSKGAEYNPALGKIPGKNAEYRAGLKEYLKNNIASSYTGNVDGYLRENLLKNMSSSTREQYNIDRIVELVTEKTSSSLDSVINASVDSLAYYNNSLNSLNYLSEEMVRNMADSVGSSTKSSLKEFVDERMVEAFDLEAGEDISVAVDSTVHEAAKVLKDVEGQVSEKLGKFDLADTKGEINRILEESGLPNPYSLDASDYLYCSANPLPHTTDLIDSSMNIELPSVEIPAASYAAIQMAAAAMHFMKAIKHLYIDPEELRKAENCLRTANWVLGDKDRAFTIVGGALGPAGMMPRMGKGFEGDIDLSKILERLSKLDLSDFEAAKGELEEILGELGSMKGQLDASIAAGLDGAAKDLFASAGDAISGLSDGINKAIASGGDLLSELGNYAASAGAGVSSFLSSAGATLESAWADLTSALDPVILYSGEFKIDTADLVVKSVGMNFEFRRLYRNQWDRDGSLGYNWTHSYDQRLIIKDKGDILFKDSDGQVYGFKRKEDGSFKAPYQLFAELSAAGDSYKMTEEDGVVKEFDKNGYLIKIEDRNGNKMGFEYESIVDGKRLIGVLDTEGRMYELKYAEGRISSLTDPFGRVVKYSYSVTGDLESVQSPVTRKYPNGKITRYSYSGGYAKSNLNHNLTMIMDPKNQVYLLNEYGMEGLSEDRVVSQRFGSENAPKMTVSYEKIENKGMMNDAASRTTVVDRMGAAKIYEHNIAGLRLSGEGYRYKYNENGQVVEEKSPEGRVARYSYDTTNPARVSQSNLLSKVEEAPQGQGTDGTKVGVSYEYGAYNQISEVREISEDVIPAQAGIQPSDPKESGRVIAYTYDEKGNLITKSDGDVVTKYAYNSKGQLISEERLGLIRKYTYEGSKLVNLAEETKELSRVVKVGYNEYGYISGITDPLGNVTEYWTNELGQVIQKRDALGTTSYYEYDENDNLVSMSIENKGTLNREEVGYRLTQGYVYDIYDNLISKSATVDRDSKVNESYVYDAEERITEVVRPDGVKKGFQYNDKGWIVAELENGTAQYTREYNNDGEVVSETDGLGNTRKWIRDGLGRVKTYIDATGTQLRINYNVFGDISEYKVASPSPLMGEGRGEGGLLLHKRFNYDTQGRLIEEALLNTETNDWAKTERVYSSGRLSEVRVGGVLTSGYKYDEFGNLVEVADATGNAVKLSYNLRGDLISKKIEKGPYSVVENYSYDALGRKIKASNKEAVTDEWGYDSIGNIVSHKDALGQETKYTHDGLGRVLTEQDGERIRKWSWDERGLLTSLVDGDNQQTSYTYDNNARLKVKLDPDGVRSEYNYDVIGRLVESKVGGQTYAYSYDAKGNLSERKSGGYEQRFVYDELNRMVSTFDSNDPGNKSDDVESKFSYGSLGQLISESINGKAVRYNGRGLDNERYRSEIVYPSGMVVDRIFDASDKLVKLELKGENLAEYEYNLFGWRSVKRLENGIIHNFEYDNLMRLSHESVMAEGDAKIYDYEYGYDALNRVALTQDSKKKRWFGYSYDTLNHLNRVAAVKEKPAQNIFSQIWALSKERSEYKLTMEGDWLERSTRQGRESVEAGGGHRYANFGDTQLVYDDRGNLIKEGEKVYEYDSWNRIIRVKENGKFLVKYTYDASNRRVSKVFSDYATSYIYSGWDVVEEYTGDWVSQQYIQGASVNEAVVFINKGTKYYYHQDRLGSVVAITDGVGKVRESYDYDAYGGLTIYDERGIQVTKSYFDNPITYTGQRYDNESGLYYYKNRYYSASLGRFLTKDPLYMMDGPNQYSYVNGDPLNWIDPMGTEKGGWFDPIFKTHARSVETLDGLGGWLNETGGSADKFIIGSLDAMNVQAWDPVYENHILGEGSWWEQYYLLNKNPLKLNYLFSKGAFGAVTSTVEGLYTLYAHPVETVAGLYNIGVDIISTPFTNEERLLAVALGPLGGAYVGVAGLDRTQTGAAIKQGVGSFIADSLSSPEKLIENSGRVAGEIALFVVGTKGADKALKGVKGASLIDEATDVAKVTQVVSKLDDPAKASGVLLKADAKVAAEVASKVPVDDAVKIFNNMKMEEVARILNQFEDVDKAAEILTKMDDPMKAAKEAFYNIHKREIDDLIAEYKRLPSDFDIRENLKNIADKYGVKLDWNEETLIKAPYRIAEKAFTDYGGDISQVKDILRTRFVVPEEFAKSGKYKELVKEVERTFGKVNRDLKDNFETPTKTGYRNVLMNPQIGEFPFEVQITVQELFDVNKASHLFVEASRKFDLIKGKTSEISDLVNKYGGEFQKTEDVNELRDKISAAAKALNDKVWGN